MAGNSTLLIYQDSHRWNTYQRWCRPDLETDLGWDVCHAKGRLYRLHRRDLRHRFYPIIRPPFYLAAIMHHIHEPGIKPPLSGYFGHLHMTVSCPKLHGLYRRVNLV